jgi:hypothetical protein
MLADPAAPSGLMRVRGTSQGKPWAKLSWPLRATDWKRANHTTQNACGARIESDVFLKFLLLSNIDVDVVTLFQR